MFFEWTEDFTVDNHNIHHFRTFLEAIRSSEAEYTITMKLYLYIVCSVDNFFSRCCLSLSLCSPLKI